VAWKEIAVGVAITLASGANMLYVDAEAKDAAEAEVKKRLIPIEEKIDKVHSSQLRMEDWFRQHLERH